MGEFSAQATYEDIYCARGDTENRIKEQQLGLFADRSIAATMRVNELRLWFSSVAYVLMIACRPFPRPFHVARSASSKKKNVPRSPRVDPKSRQAQTC